MKILVYFMIALINLGIYYDCIRDAREEKGKPEIKYTGTHKYNKNSGHGTQPSAQATEWMKTAFVGGLFSLLLFAAPDGGSGWSEGKTFLILILFLLIPPIGLMIIQSVFFPEYYHSCPDKFGLFCWKMHCLGASENDFLDETTYRTVHAPDGGYIFGYDSLTKGGKRSEIEDGSMVEILAINGNMAGCVVIKDETVCWIDIDYLTQNSN